MTRMLAMTLDAFGLAGTGDARLSAARAMPALRRAGGLAIFAGGLAVLVVHAIALLGGG